MCSICFKFYVNLKIIKESIQNKSKCLNHSSLKLPYLYCICNYSKILSNNTLSNIIY